MASKYKIYLKTNKARARIHKEINNFKYSDSLSETFQDSHIDKINNVSENYWWKDQFTTASTSQINSNVNLVENNVFI